MNSKHHQLKHLAIAALVLSACFAGKHARAESAEAPALSEKRFDLSVQDMELTEVLKMMAANHRVSIVCANDISGKVSVNFFDVTLEEALHAILDVNGLTFTRQGNMIRVMKKEEAKPGKVTKTYKLQWADPETVVEVLTELKSEEGTVTRSQDDVKLVVRDTPEIVEEMTQVVEELDQKPRQVQITTWIVELNDSDLEKIGINWSSLDNLKIFEFSGEASFSRTQLDTEAGSQFSKSIGTMVDLKAGVLADNEFNLLLNFFDTLTKSEVVSEPRIMTLDNKPATIVVGTMVPIPLYDFAQETGTRILSGFQEQKIGTEVVVTPRVHSDSYITLEIKPKVEQITDYILVDGEKQRPIVSTRQAETTVMVKSGSIVVIGGLRDKTHTEQGSQVPVLHKIPLIGGLFKSRSKDNRMTDLTIFIKPEIFDEENPLTLDEQTTFSSVQEKLGSATAVAGPDDGQP